MNFFRYKLIASSGAIKSGIVKLPYQDVISAISHLERDGSITIYVKRLGPLLSALIRLSSSNLRKKTTRLQKAEMLNNLAMMLRAGVALNNALKELAESAEIGEVGGDIQEMVAGIQSGMIFSEAAAKYPHIFPQTVLYLIRIGEETGKIDEMLREGGEHLRRIDGIISDTKQALMYPAFVFVAMGAGLLFWFYFVVPKILTLFKEMDVALPPLTLFLVGLSNFLQSNIWNLLAGVAIVVAAVPLAYKKSPPVKKLLDLALLRLPLSGTIASAALLAFITEYLALLIRAGVDILKSIDILKQSLGNAVYQQKLGEVRANLGLGESIADSFAAASIFPPFVTRMIGIGEMSGTLTEQLDYVAEEYKRKLSLLVATIGKVIEPIVLVIAGAMFAVIIGGLLLPIYDLVANIGA